MPQTEKNIAQIQEEIVGNYSFFDDWMDKYAQIIEEGKKLPAYPEEFRREEFKVQGCVSQVWLYPEYKDGRMIFYADSDALITKGLISLLLQVYSGQRPQDILASPPVFLEKMELGKHLSPNRSNGLVSMVRDIMKYARASSSKSPVEN
ncbi:SufE family protein [Kamptonema cortianum]|nr:SufE family protein [Oscillatoria laete-virens]MDK3159637.1 SufE family protein [Kamptonema cortianum]MDL5050286.1 SufE family protein [Oscillatoria amoena NRMC-F 0135]MDL5055119.1 SufE family protein [Oscillatoria laete-virens NRMC-F 0139]